MKDQQARQNIDNLFEHIRILKRDITELEKGFNFKIEGLHLHNQIVDLEKENTELREKLNAKNK